MAIIKREVSSLNFNKYNELKEFNNQTYTGMSIGGTHYWIYNNGKWVEIKQTPDRWKIEFDSLKTRARAAPQNSGAKLQSQFHWFIIADQIATKLDANSYQTSMRGIKFKLGHKRPHWRTFSYNYRDQLGYRERLIQIFENILSQLKNENVSLPINRLWDSSSNQFRDLNDFISVIE